MSLNQTHTEHTAGKVVISQSCTVKEALTNCHVFSRLFVMDMVSYIEDQSRNWSESLHMDHGQSIRKVALPGSYKEQPEQKKAALKLSPGSSAKYLSCVVLLEY